MKPINLILSMWLIALSCTHKSPMPQPPIVEPKDFKIISDNNIQSIYAGETVNFKFEISFLSKQKGTVQLKILKPSENLLVKLSKTSVTSSERIKLSIRTSKEIKTDMKYRLILEAIGTKGRIDYPFVLNVVKKDAAAKVTLDFLSKKYNYRDSTDLIVGKLLPPKKTKLNLVFSPLIGKKIVRTVTADKSGNFSIPFEGMHYGLYKIDVKVDFVTLPPFVFQASTQDTIPSLKLWTNNARKEKGDTLIVFGKLEPSPGIVPVDLEIIGPSYLGNPDTFRVQDTTTVAGEFQNPFLHLKQGLYTIIATYTDDQSGQKSSGTTIALVGVLARPGIVVFIVGGRDYNYGFNGNPHWDTQNLIVKDIYRRLINPKLSNPLKFVQSDIIYFNYMPIQNIDSNNDPTDDIVKIPSAYSSGWLISEVRSQIANKCSGLLTKVPLFIIMLGDGAEDCTAAHKRFFRISGNQNLCPPPPPDNYLTALNILGMFNPNPCIAPDEDTGIDRVFLLLSCDNAGIIADKIIKTSQCFGCDLKIATPNYNSDVIYVSDSAKEGSFEWQFFNCFLLKASSGIFPELHNDCFVGADAYVKSNLISMWPCCWSTITGCSESFDTTPR